MGNALNRIGNTVSIPGRLLKTGLTASADVFDTLAAIPKDMGNIVSYTSTEIKNVFKSAWTKGKRYQRIGNTILSPFVALGVAVEGAVRSVVTPATNFVANTFKTGKNIVSNTLKSTFGSLFSKKPVSDFKYDELKTSNVIEKNKNWFSKLRLSRKVFQDNEQRVNNKPQPSETRGTSQQNQTRETNSTKESNQTQKGNNEVKNSENDGTSEAGNDNGENVKENKDSKGNKDTPQGDSNNGTTGGKNKENSSETSGDVQENSEHIGVDEAKRMLSDSTCGKIIIDRLCESHKDFGIIFDNTTADGKCGSDHKITVGTKMPNRIKELAPFNWESRNPEAQKKHILLHELSHGVIYSHAQEIPGIQEGLDLIKQYIEARKNIDGRTLSLLSYRNDTYGTTWEKAREDFVEMLALRMNGNGNLCKKYLKLLSDDEHKDFRENNGLAKISEEDASKLQNIFDSIIRFYENISN